MTTYKHTQISPLMISITVLVLAVFVWMYITAASEPPSVDSGPNAAITALMALIVLLVSSFMTLRVCVDDQAVDIAFGYGIYRKKFLFTDIASVKPVRNHWYYGWGIRWWMRPRMVIYNVYGLDAVEIVLTHGAVYRIGTDQPTQLHQAIQQYIQ